MVFFHTVNLFRNPTLFDLILYVPFNNLSVMPGRATLIKHGLYTPLELMRIDRSRVY